MVGIYIPRKNIPCHTIVGLCPPISTSGLSKNVNISAGSGFAGPTLPYPTPLFNSNPNSMVRDSRQKVEKLVSRMQVLNRYHDVNFYR